MTRIIATGEVALKMLSIILIIHIGKDLLMLVLCKAPVVSAVLGLCVESQKPDSFFIFRTVFELLFRLIDVHIIILFYLLTLITFINWLPHLLGAWHITIIP